MALVVELPFLIFVSTHILNFVVLPPFVTYTIYTIHGLTYVDMHDVQSVIMC